MPPGSGTYEWSMTIQYESTSNSIEFAIGVANEKIVQELPTKDPHVEWHVKHVCGITKSGDMLPFDSYNPSQAGMCTKVESGDTVKFRLDTDAGNLDIAVNGGDFVQYKHYNQSENTVMPMIAIICDGTFDISGSQPGYMLT